MILSIIICIAGLVLYVFAGRPKGERVGWWAFAVGLIFVLWYAGASNALPAWLKS